MGGKDKDAKGKPSIFDRLKKLMNATEPDESQIENGEVDISSGDSQPRPIMEEIFSDSNQKMKTTKTSPLGDADKKERQKPVHLRVVKLEDIKKEAAQEEAESPKTEEPQAAPAATAREPEKSPKPKESAPSENTPQKEAASIEREAPRQDKPQEEQTESTQDKPVQNTRMEQNIPAQSKAQQKQEEIEPATRKEAAGPETALPDEGKAKEPENAAAATVNRPSPPKQVTKGAAAVTNEQQPDDRLLDMEAAKSAALYDEKESLLTRLSGKLSAFWGFVNAKPDEYAPDEEDPARQEEPAPSDEPIEILKKPEPKQRQKTAAQPPSVPEPPLQKGQKAVKAPQKVQKEAEETSSAPKRYPDFVKLSVQRLPESDAEKMLVNGVRVPEYIHENRCV